MKTKLLQDTNVELVNVNGGKVYTNGTTIDIRKDSTGSAYFICNERRRDFTSPILQARVYYDVKLNPNSGTIAPNKDVTKYYVGEETKLPTANDISRPGHTFTGWYDNIDCTGTPILKIPADAVGNKQYWAGWAHNDSIGLTKKADWTQVEGEVPGPLN